jgi:hypothetical protein
MPEQEPPAAAAKPGDGGAAPRPLRCAIVVLGAQSVALLALLIGGLVGFVGSTGSDPLSTSVGLIIVTACASALLAVLARALYRRQSWARGPAIVIELLLLPMGATMTTNGLPALGIPVIMIGLFGAGGLLAPSTRAALGLR